MAKKQQPTRRTDSRKRQPAASVPTPQPPPADSEARLREIADHSREVFWSTTPRVDQLLYINRAFETVWGISVERLREDTSLWFEAIHPDDRPGALQAIARLEAGQPMEGEYRIVRPDGTVRRIHDRGFPIRNALGVITHLVGVAEDVTEQREAEEALHAARAELENRVRARTSELEASNQALRAEIARREQVEHALQRQARIFAHLYDAVFVLDKHGRVVEWNPGAERAFGRARADMLGRLPWRLVVPADRRRVFDEVRSVVARHGSWQGKVRCHTAAAGDASLCDVTVVPLHDEHCADRETLVVSRDITAQDAAAEQLRHNERRYRAVFEHLSVAIAELDVSGLVEWLRALRDQGTTDLRAHLRESSDALHAIAHRVRIADANSECRRYFGAPDKRTLQAILPGLLAEEFPAALIEQAVALWTGRTYTEVEISGQNLAGEEVHGLWRWARATGTDRWETSPALLAITDLSDRKRAEDRLLRFQAQLAHVARLSTMGEMAAGLAHELNQPLTAIASYAHGVLRRLRNAQDDPLGLTSVMERVAREATRGGLIIRRLRSFVRRHEPRRSTANVNDLVREVADFLLPEARLLSLTLHLDLEQQLPLVQVDPVQIEQVIVNLVRNAFEAFHDTDTTERSVTVCTAADPPSRVRLTVSDTAGGLPDTVRPQLFVPFFTTKTHGTGLGLAISKGIVEAHDGQLVALANCNGGAVFEVILPTQARELPNRAAYNPQFTT